MNRIIQEFTIGKKQVVLSRLDDNFIVSTFEYKDSTATKYSTFDLKEKSFDPPKGGRPIALLKFETNRLQARVDKKAYVCDA